MSHWNYRVMRRQYKNDDDPVYTIHEVYYNDNGDVEGHTQDAVYAYGNTAEELKADLELMLLAFDKPVLEYSEE